MDEAKSTLAKLGLHVDSESQALLCSWPGCLCAISTTNSRVTTHLYEKHGVPRTERKGLSKTLATACPAGFRAPDDIPLREDGSPEHPFLQTHDGFACHGCVFRTVSLQLMKRHFSDDTVREDCSCYGRARGLTASTIDTLFQYVYLQSWCSGPNRSYWVVERNGSTMRPIGGRPVQETMISIRQRELAYRQQKEGGDDSGGRSAVELLSTGRGPWLERTGWQDTYRDMDLTILTKLILMPDSWPSRSNKDFFLGHHSVRGQREDLISPASDERRIQVLLNLFDHVMDRCEITARSTSRNLLCWLRSTRPLACYTKPFLLVGSNSSTKRYRRLFKQCIAFALRVYRINPEARGIVVGNRLSRKQLRLLEILWHHPALDDAGVPGHRDLRTTASDGGNGQAEPDASSPLDQSDDDGVGDEGGSRGGDENGHVSTGLQLASSTGHSSDDESDGSSDDDDDDDDDHYLANSSAEGSDGDDDDVSVGGDMPAVALAGVQAETRSKSEAELIDYLFWFATSLCTQHLTDGKPSSAFLVFASGVLGFAPASRTFLPARSYTSFLSGLIYIQRLLLLELALPLQDYKIMDVKRRPRRNLLRRLNHVRNEYMVNGAQSPFEEMVSLRSYGRVIARTDSPAVVMRWSEDGQVLSQGVDLELSMGSFRQLPEYFIDRAEQLCNDLMYRWRPAIDLTKIKDDLQNTSQGFSFVQYPENNLQDAYLELLERCCTSRRRSLLMINGQGGGKIATEYLKKEEAFRAMLAPLMQLVGGQLPRCQELLSLWCTNTESGPRGIYVYDGAMIYITRHHKAKRSTNREFVVVRYLPVQVGHLLFKYLVYIRPLVEMIDRDNRRACSMPNVDYSPLLFRAERGALGVKPLTTGQLTAIFKQATKQVWRRPVNSQLLRQLCIGITEKHVREVYEPFNRFDDKGADADRNVVFAWQSGHRPLQRGFTYGLDGAFPTTLQPQLLHLYKWASTRWHEFLHLPSKIAPSAAVSLRGLQGDMPEPTQHASKASGGCLLVGTQAPATTAAKRPLEHSDDNHSRKRRSPCPPPPEVNAVKGQASPWAHGPLFGSINVFTTIDAIEERQRILSHLHGWQVTIRVLSSTKAEIAVPKEDTSKVLDEDAEESRAWRLMRRLEHIHEHTERWRFVGCEACFLQTGAPEPDHGLAECDRQPLSATAKRLLTWLESLAIPRILTGRGHCSICGHSYAVCEEVRIGYQLSELQRRGNKDSYEKLCERYDAEPGLNGYCENGPVVRRMMAALCAYDDQLLGKILSKVALDSENINLEQECQARQWFERQIRLPNDDWVPGLLYVFDILLQAFTFRKARPVEMTRPGTSDGSDESDSESHLGYQSRWGTELEVQQDWKTALDWVSERCTFCAGRGLGDEHTGHTVRRCRRGGATAVKGELGGLFYKDGILPSYGCDLCFLPYQLCSRWTRDRSGSWRMKREMDCTYSHHLLGDSIIGFASCGVDAYMTSLLEGAEDYCEKTGDVSDGTLESTVSWLAEPLIVAGVKGSEMVRQLSIWVHELISH
jgi:hypothetical protein